MIAELRHNVSSVMSWCFFAPVSLLGLFVIFGLVYVGFTVQGEFNTIGIMGVC